jgi:hypothetical protein
MPCRSSPSHLYLFAAGDDRSAANPCRARGPAGAGIQRSPLQKGGDMKYNGLSLNDIVNSSQGVGIAPVIFSF